MAQTQSRKLATHTMSVTSAGTHLLQTEKDMSISIFLVYASQGLEVKNKAG